MMSVGMVTASATAFYGTADKCVCFNIKKNSIQTCWLALRADHHVASYNPARAFIFAISYCGNLQISYGEMRHCAH